MSGRRDDAAMPNQPVASEHPAVPAATPQQTHAPRLNAAEPHPSGFAIIGSKIGPAAPARSILARPRLVEWFEQHARSRLIILSAEAGYGKTTLLGEFSTHTRDRVVWYRLERSDGDWITFLSYLVAGLRVATGLSYQASVDGALDELAAALREHLDIEAMLG